MKSDEMMPKPEPDPLSVPLLDHIEIKGKQEQKTVTDGTSAAAPQSPPLSNDEINLESGEEISEKAGWKRRVVAEPKEQLWLAGPLIGVSILQYCLQIISIMFVGHLGMGSALETLCGQAYGAKQYHMLGIHMQRAILVLLVVSIPLAFIWFYTSQILEAFGQDVEISIEAGKFTCWLIPSLFAHGIIQCMIRFLQAQNIVFPMMITSGITALLHILICWLLVYKSSFGMRGAALAISISYWINVLLLAFYIKLSPTCKMTWSGFSKKALHDIFNFLKLAIPSASMICLEYWSFEMVVLLSGLLPNPKLETSVLSISLNTCWMVYTISVGLGGAVSTRVSNELGAGQAQRARLAVYVVTAIALTEGVTVATITFSVRGVWGRLYSNEEEVIKYVSSMMLLLGVSNFLDGLQCVVSGAARGCGWQNTCSVINVIAYYVVGIPLAVLFAFVLHIGGKGLWLGIICALLTQLVLLVLLNLHTNWEEEARKAKDRVDNNGVPTIDKAS
ncbi:protein DETOXIFICATION 17-like isoform X2 [Macadamia integrifolia]|uniref:protein DETOXIFICATION 17-like isoform X2 n=1 Tax=Macadamia integrifolia TaxID=60698 RepID=UPI001C4E829A|nr:protein DETOXIFICATION 17-like isoform X2 [Macadamia integrifolia]